MERKGIYTMTPYHTGKVSIGSNYDANPLKPKYIESDFDMLHLQTALVGDIKQYRKNKLISKLYVAVIGVVLVMSYGLASAQAIYGANGQYLGYATTSQSGVTTTYNATGSIVGSSQVDNGQRSFYSPSGRYEGVNTAPSYNAPNTSINTPRQVPQVRSVGGW